MRGLEPQQQRGQVGALSPLEPSGGRRSWATHRWHLENLRLFPNDLSQYDDVRELFATHILPGHVPTRPIVTEGDAVITLGSCFAAELRRFLDAAGFSATNFWVPSGLNNTFALKDFVTWCATGSATSGAYRYERGGDGEIREWTPEAEREDYERLLQDARCFVFTLGLSEVWEDSDTGGVFWRGVPDTIFDARRHIFRTSSVEENEENILQIVDMIRRLNRNAPIVLTLSPVPLQATFRPISCFSADAVSKAVLRVAIDRVMDQAPENVFYWPSFELLRGAGPVLDYRAYGDPDARHPNRYLVYTIIEAFVRCFYGPEALSRFRVRLTAAGMAETPPRRLRGVVRDAQKLRRRVVMKVGQEYRRAKDHRR
jgi:hypothetical protein